VTLRVLICDERPLVSGGMEGLLATEPDLDVVGSADTEAQALRLLSATTPDVVLTGLRPGGSIDADFVRRLLCGSDPEPAVVVYTPGTGADRGVDDILRAGADGVLAAGASREELLLAIRAVARGHAMLDSAVARRLVDWYRSRAAAGTRPGRPRVGTVVEDLTPREREILKLTAAGLSTVEIAEALFIGGATVRTHLYRLRCKLQLRDRAQLVAYAYQFGLMR
jgi:DNA-binding NarL/FixJ family response regulator